MKYNRPNLQFIFYKFIFNEINFFLNSKFKDIILEREENWIKEIVRFYIMGRVSFLKFSS